VVFARSFTAPVRRNETDNRKYILRHGRGIR